MQCHVFLVVSEISTYFFFRKRNCEFRSNLVQPDAAHCREWRIETITTLTNQPSFKTRRTAYLSLVSDDLASILSAVAPKSSFADLRGSVHRSIVEPAADLAHQLHLTPNVYSLKWPAKQAWNRLEVYECSNLAGSGTPLDLSGTNPSSPARRRVVYLFDVAPGLFVERIELGKKMPAKAICKPNVLVYAADSEVAFKPTVMSWLGAHSNRSQASSGGLLTRTTAPKCKFLSFSDLLKSDLFHSAVWYAAAVGPTEITKLVATSAVHHQITVALSHPMLSLASPRNRLCIS